MKNRVLKILLAVLVLAITFVVGVAAGGGAVYVLTRDRGAVSALRNRDDDAAMVHVERETVGSLIVDVTPGGPADGIGLRAGDIVYELDGRALSPAYDLGDAIADHEPGDEVTLRIGRSSGAFRDVDVTLAARPEEESAAYLGVEYRQLRGARSWVAISPDGEWDSEWLAGEGALVLYVEPEGPADKAGLRNGDVIAAVDGVAIGNPSMLADLVAQSAPGDELALTVRGMADDGERTVSVTLGEHPDDASGAYLGVRLAPASARWRFSLEEGERIPRGDALRRRFEFDLPWDDEDDGALDALRDWFRSL